MASKIESKCRSGAEYSLSQSSLSITNQNKDYNSNKRIALFTSSSFMIGYHDSKMKKTQLYSSSFTNATSIQNTQCDNKRFEQKL